MFGVLLYYRCHALVETAVKKALDLKDLRFSILRDMEDLLSVQSVVTFSIQEVAKRSGLSVPTLRYYEEVGVIDAVERDKSSGHRRYTADEVEFIEAVACLRAVGLSLEEMKAYNELRKLGDAAAVQRGEMFKAHLKIVKAQIKQLKLRQDYLELKASYWDAKARNDEEEADRLAQNFRKYASRLNGKEEGL